MSGSTKNWKRMSKFASRCKCFDLEYFGLEILFLFFEFLVEFRASSKRKYKK